MVARIPLIVNPDAAQIQELPAGDTLDLPVVTLTADGTIAANSAVILTSAGRAKAIETVGVSTGSATTFHTGSSSESVYALHDGAWFGDEGVIVAAWQIKSTTGSLDQRLQIQPGTLSGNSVTWGTRVNVDELALDIQIASNGKDKGLLMYTLGSAVRVRTITIQNDKTISLGNSVTVRANSSEGSICYIGEYLGRAHFAVAYKSATNQSDVKIVNVNGHNDTAMSSTQYEIVNTSTPHETTHLVPISDEQSGSKHKFIAQVGNNNSQTFHVCMSAGTTVKRIGDPYTAAELGMTTGSFQGTKLYNDHINGSVYDPVNKKYLIWNNRGDNGAGVLRVYGVDDSGYNETINFEFETTFVIDGVDHAHYSMYPTLQVTDKGQIVVTYNQNGGHQGKNVIGTYNHDRTQITWNSSVGGTPNNTNVNIWSNEETRHINQIKADNGKIIYIYSNGDSNSYNVSGKSIVMQTATTTLTADNFLGFSSAAYSNNDAARIKVSGNTTTISGGGINMKYYVRDNGTLSSANVVNGGADGTNDRCFIIPAGKGISATTLLIT